MRQTEFERRHASTWREDENWLSQRDLKRRAYRRFARLKGNLPLQEFPAIEFPARYRALCSHLAIARERRYSSTLVERLQALVVLGHRALYGASLPNSDGMLRFFNSDFARLVREQWRVISLASLLFFGSLFGLMAAVYAYPDLAAIIVSPEQLAEVQRMYAADNPQLGRNEAESNFRMFGFYIWNNVRIGFQTFAGGIFLGLGTLFFLLFNGIYLGTIVGFLMQVGLSTQIWSFTSGHGAFELTAIAISGAAGFKLGSALIAPGPRSRRAALVTEGSVAFRLAGGAALMFLIAALIEAFWSPLVLPDVRVKYLFGGVMWILVLGYFGLAGRQRRLATRAS